MDSGMNAENIKTIEEAIELNSLPKELTPQQVIGVMDRLLVLEASNIIRPDHVLSNTVGRT